MYIVCVYVCVCACMHTCMCGCECGQITILAISVYCLILRHWLGVDIGKGKYFLRVEYMFITEHYFMS